MSSQPTFTVVNQYWQHLTSGEIYAIQYDATADRVVSGCGPLESEVITAANRDIWNFQNSQVTAAWLDTHRDQFKLMVSPFAGDTTEEQSEMGELYDGEKWIKSPLVPFGYHQLSPQHLPEPNADTSYYIVD